LTPEVPFAEMMARVRGGDQAAAAELVRRFEAVVRRTVRVRLLNTRLRRALDSIDLVQSVLGSFFVRVAMGQYAVETPEDLTRLLVRMAQNKVTDHVRHEQAERRDVRRVAEGDSQVGRVMAGGGTPSEFVSGKELLEEFRKRLTPEERELADQRAQGREWVDIAAACRQTPEGVRKRLARAIERVSQELGLVSDEVDD
jgi:RNA polymerase sigma factor (sigma-70 family)